MANLNLEKMYEDFLENATTPAPDELQNSYKSMFESFEHYLDKLQAFDFEEIFKYAYQKGYEAANNEMLTKLTA